MLNWQNLRLPIKGQNSFIYLILFLISCSDGNRKKAYEYYSNGSIQSCKTFFNAKDTSSYIYVKYFQDGEVMDSFTIVNSRKEGVRFLKSRKQKFYEYDEYKNGKLDGVCRRFSLENSLIALTHFKSGVYSGPEFIYKNDKISKYNHYSSDGIKRFEVLYDSMSNQLISGTGIVQIRYDTTVYSLGNVYEINMNIATPPGLSASYSYFTFDGEVFANKIPIVDTTMDVWINLGFKPQREGYDTLGFRWHYKKQNIDIDSGQVILPIYVLPRKSPQSLKKSDI